MVMVEVEKGEDHDEWGRWLVVAERASTQAQTGPFRLRLRMPGSAVSQTLGFDLKSKAKS